ncbi:hypothetical protein DSLASN_43450 [Desulfoluna limicola]|uniref:Uncharacterized protein n=1 Tax=Desulfoluna limicola TaxID=2810562 RepID=A0ABM7PMU7_9BACT|nr:hypothetical protein [Desulfoluna limicola]BCS98713.1 hypothetical protein DSLASN_43450 [Desulfoluna limicola]
MKKEKATPWLVLFDTLFVMLLCFATLLSAMVFTGKSGAGIRYLLDLPTLGITIGALAVYFVYLLPRSNKGLKLTIREIYGRASTDRA